MLNIDTEVGITVFSTDESEHFEEYFQWLHGSTVIQVWNEREEFIMDSIHLTVPPTLEQFKTACIAYSEEHHGPYIN